MVYKNKIQDLKRIVVIGLCLAVVPVSALEKVGVTSFQFLKIMTDARSTGMGEAYSAVGNTAGGLFWNPATLTRVNGLDFAASQTDWFLDAVHYSFALAIPMGTIGSFGIQGLYVDYGEFDETTVEKLGFIGDVYNPGLTGNILNPDANVIGLSYARSMTNKFSFGITAKYASEDLDAIKQNGDPAVTGSVMFDIGIIYDTGFKSLRLAATLRHFGPEITYSDEGFPLPQTMNMGIAGYLIGPGASLLATSSTHSLLLAADLVQPRDYDQQYNVGLEYGLSNLVFVRGGYKINYDLEGLCFGAGVKLAGIRVDYSYNDVGEYFNPVHRFTIGYAAK
ncbi:PorV/PorQ family protein [Candidatus Neomarinimicrobiota bacterium]